ncbi:MAG: TonB C-terminal domain-containing protein [Sulfurimonas sp.]|nr:TonB C-terminal domain-containing protein [Sulfurimonas sp.]
MVKNDYYFYISGFISFALFFAFIAIVIIMLMSNINIKSYALKKDNYISISLDIITPQTSKNAKIEEKLIEPISEEIESDLSIDDLFSDVSTKTIKKKKEKEIDNKRFQELTKRVKTAKLNKVESMNEKINSIKSSNIAKTTKQNSSADEVNEYFARIQAIIYKNFNPPQNTQGKSAKVVIELSAIGKMLDFRVLSPSDSEDFNKELYRIKNRLQGTLFPVNPDNKNFRSTIIITSKE